jgi:hypothetical protein
MGQLILELGAQGAQNEPSLGAGAYRFNKLMTIVGDDSHPILLLKTQTDETVGESVDPGIQFFAGNPCVFEDNGFLFGPSARIPLEYFSDNHDPPPNIIMWNLFSGF